MHLYLSNSNIEVFLSALSLLNLAVYEDSFYPPEGDLIPVQKSMLP